MWLQALLNGNISCTHDLPWCGTKQQVDTIRGRCAVTTDRDQHDATICIPAEFAGHHFEKAFGMPGSLKSSEYLLMAGPMGKYLMEGCMHAEQQAAVFEYLDLIGVFWEKTITEQRLQQLEQQMPKVLAKLEALLPAWELDINRHMMLHLAEAVRQHGPCWAWSMFGFERLWGRLTRWMTQTSHPEATMMNSWKAFITCCNADPANAATLHQLSDDPSHANAAAAALPFHYLPRTFDRETYELQLPSFMQDSASTPITLFDFYGEVPFGTRRHPDKHGRRAELHLLYCKLPGFCKPCSCQDQSTCGCLKYNQLWDNFLQDTARANPTKQQLPDALEAWRIWALQQSGLSDDDLALCVGPELSVRQFDRATIGNSTFACMRVEDAKFARDSCVLTKSDGKFWAGCVRAFLSHTPPGYEDCQPHLEADLAEVVWFAEAVPAEGITDGASDDLQCPVFKRAWQDDPTGNLSPVDRLAPSPSFC